MPLSRRTFLALAPAAALAGCKREQRPRVVVYCAQDRDFAEQVLGGYRDAQNTEVVPRYDTEGNKSVAFYNEIVAEKDHPRCDVFWNNEILGTIRLQRQGLLDAHASPAGAAFPKSARAADNTWHAFAARARVLIVNNKLVPLNRRPRSLLGLTDVFWKGKVVMAKPQFGTTATHIACLLEVLGDAAAKTYLRGLKDNGLHLAPGNKQVAEWVAQGATPTGRPAAIGFTDTDDAIIELKDNKDVSLIFPDSTGGPGRMGTLFIPNTLCIPKGAPNVEAARRLVDYLLSPAVEKSLAEGPSAQIPLNPQVTATLPPQIATPATVKTMRVDWARAADLWDQAQTFVNTVFGA